MDRSIKDVHLAHKVFDTVVFGQLKAAQRKFDEVDSLAGIEHTKEWLFYSLKGILAEIAAGYRLKRDILPNLQAQFAAQGRVVVLSGRDLTPVRIQKPPALADFYIGIFEPRLKWGGHGKGKFLLIGEVEVKSKTNHRKAARQFAPREEHFWDREGQFKFARAHKTSKPWSVKVIVEQPHWIMGPHPTKNGYGDRPYYYIGVTEQELETAAHNMVYDAFPGYRDSRYLRTTFGVSSMCWGKPETSLRFRRHISLNGWHPKYALRSDLDLRPELAE